MCHTLSLLMYSKSGRTHLETSRYGRGSTNPWLYFKYDPLTSVRYQKPHTEPRTEPSVHTSTAIPTLKASDKT